jgi:hypothetical protein
VRDEDTPSSYNPCRCPSDKHRTPSTLPSRSEESIKVSLSDVKTKKAKAKGTFVMGQNFGSILTEG